VRDDRYFVLDALDKKMVKRLYQQSSVNTSALLTDDPGDVVLSSLQLLDDCYRSVIQQ